MEQQINNVYHSIQGNIGFGKAIEYFTSNNIHIAIPLNDTQKYDLIADHPSYVRILNKLQYFSKTNINV